MTRKTAKPTSDPTFPKTPVEINGKTYNLCFDNEALAEAENRFVMQGHDVNLLRAMPVLNLYNVRQVFPCAVHTFHPELSFKEAQKLVTIQTMYPIAQAIWDAWMAAVPELQKGDDPAEKSDPIEA